MQTCYDIVVFMVLYSEGEKEKGSKIGTQDLSWYLHCYIPLIKGKK